MWRYQLETLSGLHGRLDGFRSYSIACLQIQTSDVDQGRRRGNRCQFTKLVFFIRNGHLRDLSSPGDDLEKVESGLDLCTPILGFKLIDLLADHVWLRLAEVAFSCIERTEDNLVQSLKGTELSCGSSILA